MDDDAATATVAGCAQVFDLHALKAFAAAKRVRKMLFKTDQLWSEIACYEPGQSTVMHQHPKEEEAIYVLEATANMQIDGREVVVPAGSIVRFPNAVMHDVRNLGTERCDKTLPLNEMMFHVRRDAGHRARWLTDLCSSKRPVSPCRRGGGACGR
ncbi:MAG TPA: cupin domain-containing protein [Methylomirabilota bacterium]|nr:cupin domain-containing protein [Methylomirabilota bacterium]